MSNYIAYCTMASAIFLLIDATTRYFVRLQDLDEGKVRARTHADLVCVCVCAVGLDGDECR
jgi:hypothetical protein